MTRNAFTALVFSLVALTPGTASATTWKDVGQISPTKKEGQVQSAGVDAQGNFTALFRPVIGERDGEYGDIFPVYGSMQTRERAAKGTKIVSTPGFGVSSAHLAVAPSGERIAVSFIRDGEDSATGRIEVRTSTRGGKWSARQAIATGQSFVSTSLDIATAPTGDVVISWVSDPVTTDASQVAVMAASRSAGSATFTPATRLATGIRAVPASAIDAKGNAVVAWTNPRDGSLNLVRHKPGAGFTAPETLPATGATTAATTAPPALDVAPNGRAVVSWLADDLQGAVVATTGTTTGPFQTPVALSPSGARETTHVTPTVSTDGTLTAITWTESPGLTGKTMAVLLSQDQDVATAPKQVLATGIAPAQGTVVVARGRATFVWLRGAAGGGGARVVETRSATSNGRFTRTQLLSATREAASYPRIVTSSRGEPWVSWVSQKEKSGDEIGAFTAKGSAKTGKFEARQLVFPRKFSNEGQQLFPGRGGSMLTMVTRKGLWYLRAYGPA